MPIPLNVFDSDSTQEKEFKYIWNRSILGGSPVSIDTAMRDYIRDYHPELKLHLLGAWASRLFS